MPGKIKELLTLLNECRLPQDYADRAIAFFGNPLVIFDANMRVIGITDCEVRDEYYEKMRRERYPAAELRDDLAWRKKMKGLLAREGTSEEFIFGATHLSKVMRVHGSMVGQMELGAYFRELTEEDREVFEMVCTACAVSIFNQQAPSVASGDSPMYLLEYLLDGNELSEEQVRMQASMRDWNPGRTLYVLTGDMFGSDEEGLGLPLQELLEPGDRAIHYKNYQVAVLSRGRELEEAEREWMTGVLTRAGAHCGLSRVFGELCEVKKYFQQAAAALNIGHRVRRNEPLCRYEDYCEYHLIHDLAASCDLRTYVLPELLALAEENTARRQGLMRTLLCYLDYGRSVQAAAQELHMHRNTVNYRISRVSELLRMDFNDGRKLEKLLLSVRILEYMDKPYYFPER